MVHTLQNPRQMYTPLQSADCLPELQTLCQQHLVPEFHLHLQGPTAYKAHAQLKSLSESNDPQAQKSACPFQPFSEKAHVPVSKEAEVSVHKTEIDPAMLKFSNAISCVPSSDKKRAQIDRHHKK